MTERFTNSAEANVVSGLANTTDPVTFVVSSAAPFPAGGNFRVLVGNEILLVTAVAGTSFTASRAQEGTSAASHADGAAVTEVLTAASLELAVSEGAAAVIAAGLPSGTPALGSLLVTAIAAPGTPAAGKGSVYVDSTSKNLCVTDDAGVVKHGVQTLAAVSHKWIESISDAGLAVATQPAFTDISGSVAASQLPNPSATTLGGIQSLAAAANKWINAISTSGVPSATQPAASDLSNGVVGSGAVVLATSPTFVTSAVSPIFATGAASVTTGALHLFNAGSAFKLILQSASIATADRTVTFPDPGATDTVAYLARTQTFGAGSTWQGAAVAGLYGGTGLTTAAVGDLLYASATTPTWSRLADVAVGSYLRSGGVNTAPLWSTLILPNAAATGDILMATSTNTVGRVATSASAGQLLRSSGAGMAWTNDSLSFGSGNAPVVYALNSNVSGSGSGSKFVFTNNGVGDQAVFGLASAINVTAYDANLMFDAIIGTAILFYTSNTYRMQVIQGLVLASPTGGDKGVGTINAAGAFYSNGTLGVGTVGTGTAVTLPLTAFTTAGGLVTVATGTSDERLKTFQIYWSGLADLRTITPIRYYWNEIAGAHGIDRRTEQFGFSAQNVRRVMPEAVGEETWADSGQTWLTVNDRAILGAVVNAVRELDTEDMSLRARLTTLEARRS